MKGTVASMSGVKNIEIKEFNLPEPREGEILIRVSKSNVCGSDIHMWEGKHIFKNHVLGHEMVGVIESKGEGVTRDYAGQAVDVGDRVVPVYYLTCMKCEACLKGLFNICIHGSDFQGQSASKYPHFTGSFSTHYMIQKNQYFYKVPDEVSDEVAAGANCGISQMVYALDQIDLKVNDNVVIQGAGGLGLYASAIAKVKGANIIVIDSVPSRLREAIKFGATYTVDMNDFSDIEERKNEILKLTGGKGADIVIDVAGVPPAFKEAVHLANLGGTVLEVGNVSIDEKEAVDIVPGLITRKCLTVKGVLRYQPWYLHKTLEFLKLYNNRFPFASLTDRTYSLEETQTALEKAATKEVTRAIIQPN